MKSGEVVLGELVDSVKEMGDCQFTRLGLGGKVCNVGVQEFWKF